ncbi:MAG: flagellar export chaperone FliS [Spirochaetia bacterium]
MNKAFNNKAFNNYKETKIRTASQTGLIVMLYDEVVRCIDRIVETIDEKNKNTQLPIQDKVQKIKEVNDYVNKAQDILGELMSSLDFEKGGELSSNLFNLYRFFSEQLTQTNLTKEIGELPEVKKLMISLREAWAVVENDRPDQPERNEVNIAG